MYTSEKRKAQSVRMLLVATISGSLVWHLIAMLLFSTVFSIHMASEEIKGFSNPIIVRHYGGTGGPISETSMRNMLEALKIELPVKQQIVELEYLPQENVTDAPIIDKPSLVAKTDAGLGLGIPRDLPGLSRRDMTKEHEPYRLEGQGVAIEISGRRRVIFFPPALVYPKECEQQGIEGDVLLSFVVSPDGDIVSTSLESLSGSTILDQTAIDYMRKFKFEKSSEKTEGMISLRFRFKQTGGK